MKNTSPNRRSFTGSLKVRAESYAKFFFVGKSRKEEPSALLFIL